MQNTQEYRLEQIQNWKKSLELKKILDNQGIDYQSQDYLAQLTYKIAEKAFGKTGNKNIEMKVCEMVEQQTCAICFELMVPPNYSPILMFPCGHTFCKQCTLEDGKLKINKCCLCRAKISAHAVNLSLQNLICTFSEQKQLIPQQKQQLQEQQKPQSNQKDSEYSLQYKMFKMRCEILQQEKVGLQNQNLELKGQLQQLELEVECIQSERNLNQKQQDKLKDELNGLNQLLQGVVQKSQGITLKIHQTQEQMKILDETLKPLIQEMNKYQILAKQQ